MFLQNKKLVVMTLAMSSKVNNMSILNSISNML